MIQLSWQEDAQALSCLGITVSQGKVYLALLRLRTPSKVHTIAKYTNIPRQDVYRLLDELQQIGLVQKTLLKPATFKATPPKDAIEIFLTRKKEEFSQIEKGAARFIQIATQFLGETPAEPEENQFFLIAGREEITCKMIQAIKNTERTFQATTPFSEFVPWVVVLSDCIEDALERGVKVLWITDKPVDLNIPKSLKTCINHPNFKLRFISYFPEVKMRIFDGKEVLLGVFGEGAVVFSPCLCSNNSSLLRLAQNYFDMCWGKGVDQVFEVTEAL
jgi:sugar-specific transcriptional regulator TrmB